MGIDSVKFGAMIQGIKSSKEPAKTDASTTTTFETTAPQSTGDSVTFSSKPSNIPYTPSVGKEIAANAMQIAYDIQDAVFGPPESGFTGGAEARQAVA